ncbi:hypothetical protein [Lentilactobacillus kisonensis]|nr:hypothetical protein [Lentilactobacillus kisonensis]KRL20232.1 hypothetical protein FC98_GL001810 [Lentilactobacillus kisonensis DSM 19906 = JCM 15041]
MNLDEFYRASSHLDPKLTLLVAKAHHYVPINQLTIDKTSLLLDTNSQSHSQFATITLDQFMTRTSQLSPQVDLRTANNHQLIFGFRIVNKSIVFY